MHYQRTDRNCADTDIGSTAGFVEKQFAEQPLIAKLPEEGRAWQDIRAELAALKRDDYDWRAGRLAIYVYHDNDELLTVSREAYGMYFTENALGHRAFPSLARMERDVIAMSLALFHSPHGATGSFTSGGTESIFLVLKSARDQFLARSARTSRPNIVVPITAHPTFDKAAHYLGIDVIRVPVAENLRGTVAYMRNAVSDRTMMIAGSAPCYPFGVFDDIVGLGEFALESGLWLHVDACLGGFLAPFVREEGYIIPQFDFSLPGVSSLSADLHKYGFSARGASVVLYRSAQLKATQGFHFDDWPRGQYSTETFLGSRPGGAIASAWAVMQYLGEDGYRRLARKTMETKQRLIWGIERIDGLEVIRPTDLSILLYRSTDAKIDIDGIADTLSERGWFVGRSREPRAIHMALNPVHTPIVDEYLRDLEYAVAFVQAANRIGRRDDVTY